MHIFSDSLLKHWNQWDIRLMVLLSLSLQVILIILGARRKYMVNRWLQIIVWLAYLSADTVATVSLGILTHRQGNRRRTHNNVLQKLWFPFLLLHLGGPDSITAYSLEDNELWLRHFITLVGQVTVALYVFLTSEIPSAFINLAIPMFVAGILKYGERTWVLRSASPNHMPYPKKKKKGPNHNRKSYNVSNYDGQSDIHRGYYLFTKGVNLFSGFHLNLVNPFKGINMVLVESTAEAFHLVEIELGFVYDVIYTKASIIFSKQGIFLRLISFSCFIYSLTNFATIIGKYEYYSKIDVFITYLLMVGAVVLEIYALFLAIFSDWILVQQPWPTSSRFIKFLSTKSKWWSRSMAQHNLIKFCLEKRTEWFRKQFASSQYVQQEVKDSLKRFIHQKIKEKVEACKIDDRFDEKAQKRLLEESGEQVLTKMGCLDEFRAYTIDVDFDRSLLLWHIATCICDHMEQGNHDNDTQELGRSISEYMLYLLVESPQILPTVSVYQSFYLDTCDHFRMTFQVKPKLAKAFNSKQESLDLQEFIKAAEQLLGPRKYIAQYSSQLGLGFELAQKLLSQPNKWNLISEMWVEKLIYAASHANWRYHGQRLMKGGELLTHVALLMAHLGLSQQTKLADLAQSYE